MELVFLRTPRYTSLGKPIKRKYLNQVYSARINSSESFKTPPPVREWHLIRAVLFGLEKMGVEMIGFNLETGPETVKFDPNEHNFIGGFARLDPETRRFTSREGIPEAGTLLRVSAPGFKIGDEVIRRPTYVETD